MANTKKCFVTHRIIKNVDTLSTQDKVMIEGRIRAHIRDESRESALEIADDFWNVVTLQNVVELALRTIMSI